MLKKAKAKHPNKVGRVGRKPIGKANKAIQIKGQYFTPVEIELLGGKDALTARIHAFGMELKQSVSRETNL